MDTLRLIVDHSDPSVRSAFMGVLAALLKNAGIEPTIKAFENTQNPADTAVVEYEKLAAATGNMIRNGNLSLVITEQIDVPDVMVQDLTVSAIKQLASKGGIGDLKAEGTELLAEFGMNLGAIREILEETRRELRDKHGKVQCTEAIAREICSVAKQKIRTYIESKVPANFVNVISVETLARPINDGSGYEFALAMSVDDDRLKEYRRGKDKN